ADVDAPQQLGRWLDAQLAPPPARIYADRAALAERLRAVNPRLTPARAEFLCRHLGRVRADGQVEIAGDPWHKIPSPAVYRIEDAMACWRRVRASALMLVSGQGYVLDRFGDEPDELQRRLDCFADVRVVTVADAGHNLQHDQPEQVAQALDDFLTREPT
ncbi:MAG: alpha/beta hydrolase, partial [Thauera sp.]